MNRKLALEYIDRLIKRIDSLDESAIITPQMLKEILQDFEGGIKINLESKDYFNGRGFLGIYDLADLLIYRLEK